MPKLMHLQVTVELPADEWEEARQKVGIHAPWVAYLEALAAAGLRYEAKVSCVEVRAKRSDAGRPRARKPRTDGNKFGLTSVPPPLDAA